MTLLMPCRIASVASIVVVLGVAEARQASAQVMVEALLVPRAVLASAQTVAIEARPPAVPASVRPAPLMELYVGGVALSGSTAVATLLEDFANDPPDGSGARWTLRGVLDVHAPLVGGKVAHVIVDGIREAAAAKGVLLDEWLAKP